MRFKAESNDRKLTMGTRVLSLTIDKRLLAKQWMLSEEDKDEWGQKSTKISYSFHWGQTQRVESPTSSYLCYLFRSQSYCSVQCFCEVIASSVMMKRSLVII